METIRNILKSYVLFKWRNLVLFVFLLFSICTTKAQNYQISFTGSGESISVDSVKVLNLTQCTSLTISGSDTLILFGPGGISNTISDKTSLIIYPNPMTQTCNVEFYNSIYGDVNIAIYDISGKVICQRREKIEQGRHKYTVTDLEKGIYVINIISPENNIKGRIISINENPQVVSLIRNENNNNFSSHKSELKNTKSLVQMQYNDGERLLLKGISGDFSRIITMIPTQSQTVDFEFIKCLDGDNNHYSVVTIGTKTWMAENLKTTKYNDGDTIPYGSGGNAPQYCWYSNNYNTYGSIYGAMYNWFAVDTLSNGMKNVCPVDWHVASYAEWTVLSNYLGGNNVSGGKLKETCSIYWDSPNVDATNESGFTALPGGFWDGMFSSIHDSVHWWTSTKFSNGWAYDLSINDIDGDIYYEWWMIDSMESVRCIKDKD
ncbi:MAG: FISUMP domain-containing protein [Bacteroidota bacterium]